MVSYCLNSKFLSILFNISILCIVNNQLRAAELSIPLSQPENWQILKYRSITPNSVDFTPEGMLVTVNQSASPIILPIKPDNYKNISVEVMVNGKLNTSNLKQGSPGADDFLFRLGLVYQGEQKLNFWRRQFAPKWIKTLHKLAPKGTGIGTVHFYNVVSDASLKRQVRTHPDSRLVIEHFEWQLDSQNSLIATLNITDSPPLLALWLSSDGDDTLSTYQVLIKSITLNR